MTLRNPRVSLGLVILTALFAAGCSGKEKIVLVPVEGKLMMNGQPVPLARIEFMPEFKGHGAESNASATTDETGKFVLQFATGETGCAIAKHKVVINEAPVAANMRGQDEASQNRYAEYARTLKNRPLPANYQMYSTTPLTIEITGEKRDLLVEMKR
ncbi:MAG: hypothetical protein QM703_21840 [Gemmatales bacterium]